MIKYIVRYSLVLLIILLTTSTLAENDSSSTFPDKKHEWINDFANLIGYEDSITIESLCKQIYKEELATVVICTIESIPKNKKEYKTAVLYYGTDLLNHWHIGRKGVDDGILILISRKDRKVAICTGYLTEHFLPDAEAKRIINAIMIPMFRNDEYGKGIVEGIKEARKVMIKNRKLMYPEKYEK